MCVLLDYRSVLIVAIGICRLCLDCGACCRGASVCTRVVPEGDVPDRGMCQCNDDVGVHVCECGLECGRGYVVGEVSTSAGDSNRLRLCREEGCPR